MKKYKKNVFLPMFLFFEYLKVDKQISKNIVSNLLYIVKYIK